MRESLISLKRYFITNLVVTANGLTDPSLRDRLSNQGATLTTKVHREQHESNERNWRVVLQISCLPKEGLFCPYSIQAELVGIFEVDQRVPIPEVVYLVTTSAPAILFGSARELILLVTGRGPFSAYYLPSVTFADEAPLRLKANPPSRVIKRKAKKT